MLISRFLLALQDANQMVVGLDPNDLVHSSSNPFDITPSFISSLGGFINPEHSSRSDDDNAEFQEHRAGAEKQEEEVGGVQGELSRAAASPVSA